MGEKAGETGWIAGFEITARLYAGQEAKGGSHNR